MKTLPKVSATLALILLGALASGSAMADYRGHGGHVRFGISFGVPLYAPGFYPVPYYAYPAYPYYAAPVYAYPPLAIESPAPPVYVERGAPEAQPAPAPVQADWYYCAAAKAYYPYVAECPAGWQRVPAQLPSR